jgi:uncharacterized membrane protein
MLASVLMRKAVTEKLATDVAEWGHQGLISDDVQQVLLTRYSVDETLGRVLLRWLGFIALLLLASSVLGFISNLVGDGALYLAMPLLGGLAYELWRRGTAMAIDPAQRYATSGAVLVTLSLFVAIGPLALFIEIFDIEYGRTTTPIVMLIISALALFTAYRHGLRWPLLIGVLLVFHALGNMHRYGGGGSYYMGINDEQISLAVALAALCFGLWHERVLERNENRLTGFGHIYIVIGLLYANLSLWFLSIPWHDLVFPLVFAAAGIGQLVAGGRLHDGRFTGFGIVFLSINFYTRMFEGFWDELSKGTFFLLSGAVALVLGIVFEQRARKMKAEAGE